MKITTLPKSLKEFQTIIDNLKQTYEFEIRYLREQLNLMRAADFGRRSEKLSKTEEMQGRLFNESEVVSCQVEKETAVIVKEHTRKKGGRKPIPDNWPREEIIHDLTDEEKIHSCGQAMKKIGEDVSYRVRIVPVQKIVEVHKRYKYACPCQGIETEGIEGAVRIAAPGPQMIEKSIATSSLLAYVITGKFCDGLPFARQEKILERYQFELSRQTMSQWAMKIHDRTKSLGKYMEEDIKSSIVIGMDETRVQVMNEKDRENTALSQMWVQRGGPPGNPIILFRYFPSRSGIVARELLEGFKGYLQCDGYAGYASATRGTDITLVGCWAHARRKFMEALKAAEEKSPGAEEALRQIGQLYAVEKECRENELNPEETQKVREEKSAPLLTGFKKWLDEKSVQVPPTVYLGKAILYTLGEWNKLTAYARNGHIPIDNNLTENAIRPFVIGRKNWLFSASPEGADASAMIYSLIETARANKLEPFWYLTYLFDKWPLAETDEEKRALLPYKVTVEMMAEHFVKSFNK